MTKTNIAQAQKVYEEAYEQKWNELKGKSPIRIVEHENPLDDNSPVKRVFEEEGNFFLCGFNWLHFGRNGNAGLKPALEAAGCRVRKDYPSGYACYFNEMNLHGYGSGNGDFMIQEHAYGEAAKYLRSIGFDVYAESRLD